MHIPDGFIPLWQCAIYYVILIVALYFSQKWARKNLDEKMVPLMAVLAAGIFAIMSMNMPIPFGTSGHMVGGALVAIVFCAPEAAIIVFTLVLLVQGIFFGDGGVTALGANVLNMGIIGGFTGLYVFKALRKPIGKYPAIAIASWLSIFLAAEAVAVEMWLAGTFPLGAGLIFMGLYHAFIGIIEAVLTVVVIMALEKLRPDLLGWNRKRRVEDIDTETGEVAS
ncbi:cobalamin (vitamin B12) biosynthesis CbiM protein [Methanobacterium lacus]|uniref:Cobalamin (Vitamin B12) biosynthesis CbiM protein n=1 Tax=Methanobacterium lacus (strain AL-21) TaxID=877455 RepID=F0T6U2_METLA|nr:cobalt transporter CbiM [Methanobacterium lacus]ADZ08325.1 cobalamin (vitamin B12) biosynthesis CbiM protein [Methanobacterium lacus]